MSWIEALILGLIQGLTEFLPVSSSGHIEIGKAILGVHAENNLAFTVTVHGATVLSTIIVFRKEILSLLKEAVSFQWNESIQYILKITVSMIPIGIAGVFFKDEVADLFDNNRILLLVGFMLLVTATFLAFTYYAGHKEKNISFLDALIIGVSQTFALLPGISRSGTTIATGLLLGNKKSEIAKFSFLMVLAPIIGENILSLLDGNLASNEPMEILPLVVAFVAAFVSGLIACSWMIKLVKKGKLVYFAVYCLIIGGIVVFAAS